MPKNSSPRQPARDGITYVYRFFSHEDALLYIGVTNDLGTRFTAHQKKPWWSQASHSTVEAHGNRALALAAEAMAILNEKPLHNIQRPQQERVQVLQSRVPGVPVADLSPYDPVAVLNRAHDRIERLEADLRRVRSELTSVSAERDRLATAQMAKTRLGNARADQRELDHLREQLRVSRSELKAAEGRAERAELKLEEMRLKRIIARSRPATRH